MGSRRASGGMTANPLFPKDLLWFLDIVWRLAKTDGGRRTKVG